MEPVQGYLEIMDKGFGFLRNIEENFNPKPENPYVPEQPDTQTQSQRRQDGILFRVMEKKRAHCGCKNRMIIGMLKVCKRCAHTY